MLTPVYVIERKRDGHVLTKDQIDYLIAGYAAGDIPDYQMSAWAMAVYLMGMQPDEVAHLTEAMIASGDTLKPFNDARRVDKHSTGGLGDKVSLVLAPLLACVGLQVPMISGRGLGITGGTLDKLEAIPGFRTDLSESEIDEVIRSVGCVITGASSRLVPADKKLYGLRDVTATVPSIPLITASILSKKFAESLDALVMDVKFGSGAFMQTESDARALARSLVSTGNRLGIHTSALLTDMTQPLGKMIGNGNEVMESIELLKGNGPSDARELTIELSARLMKDAGVANNLDDARSTLAGLLGSGDAYERFERMVAAQGGDLSSIAKLGIGFEFKSKESGYIVGMNGQRIGHAVIALGGGRKFVGQPIDHRVGIEMHVRVGDFVEANQTLLTCFKTDVSDTKAAIDWLEEAFEWGDSPSKPVPLFQEVEG